MKNAISIIGIGRLGLCLALNFTNKGYDVTGIDSNKKYVDLINTKQFQSTEPGVNELLQLQHSFNAHVDLFNALKNDIIFIVLPTPSLKSGKYDCQYIDETVNKLMDYGIQPTKKYLIISSTVSPGYCDSISQKLNKYNYEIVYNPEFIAQGSILNDQLNPDFVLIGCQSIEGKNIVESLYLDLCQNNPTIHKMSLIEAEIAKIALNCFITTKIAYANMVGDIAVKLGASPDTILNAIGSDSRIGNKYLKYGFGFGGPCFPRDNRAFGIVCEENGIYPYISYATDKSNNAHLGYQIDEFIQKNPNKTIPVTIKHVTYKINSDILEESQRLKFAEELQRLGYTVIIQDKLNVIEKLQGLYENTFKYEII